MIILFQRISLCAQEYDEEAITAVLEGLAPWNLRVMWASKRFKVWLTPFRT